MFRIIVDLSFDTRSQRWVAVWSVAAENDAAETWAALGGVERARDLDLLLEAVGRRVSECLT